MMVLPRYSVFCMRPVNGLASRRQERYAEAKYLNLFDVSVERGPRNAEGGANFSHCTFGIPEHGLGVTGFLFVHDRRTPTQTPTLASGKQSGLCPFADNVPLEFGESANH